MENSNEGMTEKLHKKDEQIDGLKKNVENLESTVQKAEQDKQAKDNQIKTLQTDMARQEETIGKLGKDKKALEETIKKTQSDLAAEEDKVNQLNKLKQKLESNIDEVGRQFSSTTKPCLNCLPVQFQGRRQVKQSGVDSMGKVWGGVSPPKSEVGFEYTI